MPAEMLAGEVRLLRVDVVALTSAVAELTKRTTSSEDFARKSRRFLAGLLVSLVLDLGITGYLVHAGHRAAVAAACQAHYNEINNERTRILTEIGATERSAQRARDDALDATFLDPSLLKPVDQRTPAEQQRVRDLFVAYREAAQALVGERAKADAAREANPVPPSPSQACD